MTQVGLTLADYLGMWRRHFLLSVGVVVFGSLAALLLAVKLPGVYESTTIIQVDEQTPESALNGNNSDNYADAVIDRVRQRVLTRDNILDIARRYQLYGADQKASASDVMVAFNKDVSVDLIHASGPHTQDGAIAFTVSFRGKNSWAVYKVDSELTTLFLNENMSLGNEQANTTNQYLADQAKAIKDRIDEIGQKILVFKEQNKESLPENKEQLLAIYSATDYDLREIETDRAQAENSLSLLQVMTKTAASNNSNGQLATDPNSELDSLKAQYAKLQATYSESHPTMVLLRQQMEALSQEVKHAVKKPSQDDQNKYGVEQYQRRLVDLDHQRTELMARKDAISEQLLRMPEVGQQEAEMELEYDALKKKYASIKEKQFHTQLAVNAQGNDQGEMFTLVQPAMQTDKPIKPNRLMVLVGGIAGSVVLAILLIVWQETKGGKVLGVAAIASLTGMMPLVVIPEIESYDKILQRNRVLKQGFLWLMACLVVFLLLTQFFIMPLPDMVSKLRHFSTVPMRGTYAK